MLPREKLSHSGPATLSDEELLAILIGSGNKLKSVRQLARELLPVIDEYSFNLALNDLLKIKGIGLAKATLILSALEFARRRIRPRGVKVKSMADVIPLVQHYAKRQQEHFICITLNGANEVTATRVVTIGLVNMSQVHPREVFADAISDRACSVIVAHNHPSGNLLPSREDIAVTKVLEESGKLLGINLLDHIIFSQEGYESCFNSKI